MWQTLACIIIRPKQVRPLTYPEHVQKAWGFSFAGGAMRIRLSDADGVLAGPANVAAAASSDVVRA